MVTYYKVLVNYNKFNKFNIYTFVPTNPANLWNIAIAFGVRSVNTNN